MEVEEMQLVRNWLVNFTVFAIIDRIIDKTSEQLGYFVEFVRKNEQSISTSRLWKMIFSNSGIPVSMILRNRSRVLRVFITSSEEYVVNQVSNRFHISPEEALRKINRINTGRSNYYWKYTGKQWSDVDGYDLMINIDNIGLEGAVDIILEHKL